VPYLPFSFNDVKCICKGSALTVVYNGVKIFAVSDAALTKGKVGVYVWKCRLTEFEDLVVKGDDAFQGAVRVVQEDDFEDQRISGWSREDHATNSGASTWVETATILMQLSSIGDAAPNDPVANPGTVFLPQSTIPDDVQFTVQMSSLDKGSMGVVFRYQDAGNHYRFVMNRAARFRQLQKAVGGQWSILWQDRADYNLVQWYRIRTLSVGDRHRIFVDGELLVDVVDAAHQSGRVGMYCWQNAGLLLDNALIQTPHDELPVLVGITSGNTTQLLGRAPQSAGQIYGLGLAFSATPGMPLAWLKPTDPRILGLTPDSLFEATLKPSPYWSNLHGKLDGRGQAIATIDWPVLAALRGRRMYAAGWTGDITRSPIVDVFPTLQIVYP
jgi:hypothetical protein